MAAVVNAPNLEVAIGLWNEQAEAVGGGMPSVRLKLRRPRATRTLPRRGKTVGIAAP